MSYISFEEVCKEYHVGDMVVHAADHVNFQIEKDIIIKNGENISAKEIEKALLKCDGIQNAQVLGTPSAVSGEEIDACLMLKSNCRFDEKALRSQLSEYLPKFKMPERFFLFDAFPLDENGKVVSRILREKLESALVKG